MERDNIPTLRGKPRNNPLGKLRPIFQLIVILFAVIGFGFTCVYIGSHL